ncbi:TlpA family protein disulfide reductase [Paenibacillus xanthanilyticus]|uniref:TlpA family protein disulfide reductase n=1 Tax=Paenibacillus xanthanilyticus TaxID=1783531 RepID=A0ABV8KBK6_9BACL
MYTVQAGQLALNLEIAVYLLSGLAGVLGVRLRAKRGALPQTQASDALQAVFLWLIVWKASIIVFDPVTVMAEWRSLLYFSGGSKGAMLASVVSSAYLLFKGHRAKVGLLASAETVCIMAFGAAGTFMAVEPWFADSWSVRRLAATLAALLLTIWLLARRESPDWRKLSSGVLLGCLALMTVMRVQFPAADDPLAASQAAPGSVQIGAKQGQLAPDIRLVDRAGKPVALSAYKGKVVVLNFWASWCPPCQAEMPHMQKLYDRYDNEEVVLLSVNMTTTERGPDAVWAFADKKGTTFPIVLDEEGAAMAAYNIRTYPTTVFIAPDGIIHARLLGAVDYDGMHRIIRDMS